MNAKELIDKQIAEALNFHGRAKTAKDRDRDGDKAFKALHATVGRVLEALMLQRARIDELEDALASVKVDVDDLVDAVGYEEQKHEEARR